jgi:hypothetical protein
MTGTVLAAVVAAVALTGGAGAVDVRGEDRAPSGRTSVSSVHHDVARPVTSIWRPR